MSSWAKNMYNEKMETFDYQIIANLLAGKGLTGKILKELEEFLSSNKLTYRVLAISKPSPISLLPPDGKTTIKKGVICLGGDGTVSETIGFMAKRKISLPIFIIPTGTANFLANSIGISLKNGFLGLFNGRIKEFDLGLYRDSEKEDYFLMGIGLGFEHKFLEMAKQHQKKFLGKISYYLAAIRELFRLRTVDYQLSVEEKQLNFRSPMVTVLNLKPKITRLFPLFLEKDIRSDDGWLDLIYVEHKNYLIDFLAVLFFHLFGSLDFGLVSRMKVKKVKINSPTGAGLQLDGEIKGKIPFEISVEKGKIQFLI